MIRVDFYRSKHRGQGFRIMCDGKEIADVKPNKIPVITCECSACCGLRVFIVTAVTIGALYVACKYIL